LCKAFVTNLPEVEWYMVVCGYWSLWL